MEDTDITDIPTTTILYTHNIRGDLDMLPRLYTFIRRLRGELAEGQMYLIDLGASCVPDVWPCAITEGRSTLLVLDAMGYHAANVDGALTPTSRAKLVSHIGLALVDSAHSYTEGNIHFTTRLAQSDSRIGLHVCLAPSDQTTLIDGTLRLQGVEGGQVGLVRVRQNTFDHAIHKLPAGTPPEPTISGAVDFVREEARYFEKRQQDE